MQLHFLSIPPQLSSKSARLLLAIGWMLVVFGLALFLLRMPHLVSVACDFAQDYVAGRSLREGRSIYDEFTQADLSAAALGTTRDIYTETSFTNFHPPSTALLFVPVSLLPYQVAIVLWSVLSLVLYLMIIWLVLRELAFPLARQWQIVLIGLALCWYPFQAHIALGQIGLPLIACVVGCWALLRRGHDRAAGALLGVACLIKLFPGLLVLYLLLRRRWPAVATAISVLSLSAALTLATVGWNDIRRYFFEMAPRDVADFGLFPVNFALTGVIGRLFSDGAWVQPLIVAPRMASALIVLSSVGLVGLMSYHAWRWPRTRWGDDTSFALACLAMLLVSPISWEHVLPILILPLGLLLQKLLSHLDRRTLALSLLVLTLVSLPDYNLARLLMRLYEPYRMPWYASLLMLGPMVGSLILWWLLATHNGKEAVALNSAAIQPVSRPHRK